MPGMVSCMSHQYNEYIIYYMETLCDYDPMVWLAHVCGASILTNNFM